MHLKAGAFLVIGVVVMSINLATSLRITEGSQFDGPEFELESDMKRLFSGKLDVSEAPKSEPYDNAHRSSVLEGCGEICDTTITGTKSKYFNLVRKAVDCDALWANAQADGQAKVWPPPKDMPANMKADYTMNGKAKIHPWYTVQRYGGNADYELKWTAELIQNTIDQAKAGKLEGSYGVATTSKMRAFLQKHRDSIEGKRFFVIGSERPWLEALLLEAGAKHVTTIEYGRIRSEDPRVTALLPSEMRQMMLNSTTKPQFDGGATFSSLEHSGLGRYGDTLNPWGDLQAMAKAWCITKSGGPMFVGEPSGAETVNWNAHRVYGPNRWAQLMANWEQHDKQTGLAMGKDHTMYKCSKLS